MSESPKSRKLLTPRGGWKARRGQGWRLTQVEEVDEEKEKKRLRR